VKLLTTTKSLQALFKYIAKTRRFYNMFGDLLIIKETREEKQDERTGSRRRGNTRKRVEGKNNMHTTNKMHKAKNCNTQTYYGAHSTFRTTKRTSKQMTKRHNRAGKGCREPQHYIYPLTYG
jgi:hypothetical protein